MNLKDSKTVESLRNGFGKAFGTVGALQCALSPGRVNLIGEHTDYNGGLVLPLAIARHTAIVFKPNGLKKFRIFSHSIARLSGNSKHARDEFGLTLNEIPVLKDSHYHWANYIRGVGASLLKRGVKLTGGDFYIDSDLPAGAGLSSSASLEVGVAQAMLALAGKKMDPQQVALAAQWAEHNYAGVRCGIMDQSVVARGKAGHALMLDCRSLKVTHVPINLKGWAFAVFDTNVRHKLAGSEYNKRRSECEHAAKVLGVKTLREATIEEMLKAGKKLTANEHKRVRHEISENIRTSQFADLLGTGDIEALGWLLITGHQSLAHDYEVSCPELNFLAAILSSLDGCAGARMTGGGFGGSVVALVQPKHFDALRKNLARAYKKEMGRELGGALLLEPSPGAQVYSL